jgi:hypothetical protein
MEHTEAMETLAAERYLLNEMMQEDREAFEDHFFGCAECAADVRAGTAIRAGVRAAKAKPTTSTATPRIMAWLSAAASLGLAARLGYIQLVTLPAQQVALAQAQQMRQEPRVLKIAGLTVPESGVRGEATPIDRPFDALEVTLPLIEGAERFVVTIFDAENKQRGPAHRTTETVRVTIAVGNTLPPGRYTMVVKPEPAGKPVSKSFEVR